MSVVNIHDQALRYHNLRQGDKEFISDFKIRFDNQVKSNQGVGMPEISEKLCAMDFIWGAQRWEVAQGIVRGHREVGAVHCRSAKQSIVSKSSMEAELVGLSDSANHDSNQGLHARNFLARQGYRMPLVTVYQDNMSWMAIIARGRLGAERTRQRYVWAKEHVDNSEMKIEHKGTKERADVLTKPLQGSQFVYERTCLTGWAMN
jgi:hypothetical protein